MSAGYSKIAKSFLINSSASIVVKTSGRTGASTAAATMMTDPPVNGVKRMVRTAS